MKKKGITRRDFLRGAAGATLVGVAGTPVFGQETQALPKEAEKKTDKKSKVILVRDKNVLDADRKVNAEIIQKMLDDGVTALIGEPDPIKAWKTMFGPSDTVGIKTNVWKFIPVPSELEKTIKKRLIDTGVNESKITIGDRGILKDSLFWESTALINVRPMRTHHWAGVGSLIKNYIMFSPSPSSWHDDTCANLAGVWELPIVKGKTKLNILVMLTPLFQGKGPHNYQQQYTWEYNGLLIGTDPVAVDATGVRILEAKRLEYFGEEKPFEISPKHIKVADEKYHLGTCDPNKIELVRLGWTENILI